MMATILAPTSDLILIRHEIRTKRVAELMLASRVLPESPLEGATIHCRQCGAPKPPHSMCRTCHPRRDQPKRNPETGYKRGAKALGISVDDYRQHRESGEKWCYFHKRWEPAGAFAIQTDRPDGLRNYCRDRVARTAAP